MTQCARRRAAPDIRSPLPEGTHRVRQLAGTPESDGQAHSTRGCPAGAHGIAARKPEGWIRLLQRAGKDRDFTHRGAWSLQRDDSSFPQRGHYREPLLEEAVPARRVDPDCHELLFSMTQTESDFEPAIRQVVEHRDVFSQRRWQMQWQRVRQHTQPNRARALTGRGDPGGRGREPSSSP